MLYFAESEEIVDYQGEVNTLLKKVNDEISIENLGKEASGESTEEAVLKELGIQLQEGKIDPFMTVLIRSEYQNEKEFDEISKLPFLYN